MASYFAFCCCYIYNKLNHSYGAGLSQNDFLGFSNEKQVMDDLRKHNLPEGNYSFPRAKSMKDMKSPEFLDKMRQGPVGMMTITKADPRIWVKS